ncbi:MAG: tetratricopeptide repeat protein [Anaerolineae bacterium]|nr:tetratricopeptide repeat protein [Anaerolineae bacterium]
MGFLSGFFKKEPEIDINNIDQALQQAFTLGEAKDAANRQQAIKIYRAIVDAHPEHYTAWYNLGVIQSRGDNLAAAVDAFARAQADPDLEIGAAFARLWLMIKAGKEVPDSSFPPEFRGENRGALGVQGPCHNAANELRNRGYDCTVEGEGKSATIIVDADGKQYKIALNDFMGMLMKNIYRVDGDTSTSLGDIKVLSEVEQMLMRLKLNDVPPVQAPVGGALDSTTYQQLRADAQRKTGPHGWVREGLSFAEVAEKQAKEAAERGVHHVQIMSLDSIAQSNCSPASCMVAVLDGEPSLLAVLGSIDPAHIPMIKRAVEGGATLLRGEFFSMPTYPIIHLGVGVPVASMGQDRFQVSIVESATNFAEANFQDWVVAIEARKQTMMHVFDPSFKLIASGPKKLDPEIVQGIVDAVNQANAAFQTIPPTSLDLKQAMHAFFEKYPDPFIWSE